MKNSAWYSKLWRKKLDELPLKKDAGASWTEMQGLLDQHLPVNNITGNTTGHGVVKSFFTKLISAVGYILPMAAIIGAVSYFALKPNQPQNNQKVKKHTEVVKTDTTTKIIDSNFYTAKKRIEIEQTGYSSKKLTVNSDSSNNDIIEKTSVNAVLKAGGRHQPGAMNNQNLLLSSNTNTLVNNPDTNAYTGKIDAPNKAAIKNDIIIAQDMVKNQSAETDGVPNNTLNTAANTTPGNTQRSDNLLQTVTQSNKMSSDLQISGSTKKIKSPSVSSQKKPKTKKENTPDPDLVYGIKIGIAGNASKELLLGVFSSYKLNVHWFADAEIIAHAGRNISGTYTHPSYFRPDSIAAFGITSSRKIYLLDIPLNIGYKISNVLSIKAGPVITLPLKQSGVINNITNLPDIRDTLYHSNDIKGAFAKTVFKPGINMGISTAVSININRFIIEGRYIKGLTPYKVESDLGEYRVRSNNFQFTLGFKLNKKNSLIRK